MPIKFLLLGGGLWFFRRGGGGSANFIFMGVGIFPIESSSCRNSERKASRDVGGPLFSQVSRII